MPDNPNKNMLDNHGPEKRANTRPAWVKVLAGMITGPAVMIGEYVLFAMISMGTRSNVVGKLFGVILLFGTIVWICVILSDPKRRLFGVGFLAGFMIFLLAFVAICGGPLL